VTLLLSGRCNLACAYCYQAARSCGDRLSWENARAALDQILASKARFRAVEFSGGEPLLEWNLLTGCAGYVESRRQKGRPIRFLLTTNGTLLTPEMLAWLEANRFSLRLSFDGPGAQGRRSAGSLERLDCLLEEIRGHHPSLFRRLRVHAAVLPSSVESLAESAAYFLRKGVPEVFFYPVAGGGEPWSMEGIAGLRAQAAKIVQMSAAHLAHCGTVPVLFLRAGAPGWPDCPKGAALCGASRGDGFCVDPDGRAWSCPFFAASLANPPEVAREAARVADLGEVADPRFSSRLAALPGRAASVGLISGRERKRSGYRACAGCEFLSQCAVCPAAAAAENPEGDPGRVSDFACAFSTATLEARRNFAARTAGAEAEAQFQRLRQAAAALAAVLRGAGS
jgi:sulfatase maturation enzyme AslB (radical SAM superfamily)